MTDFDALPPPLQRAITARDLAVKPFHPAIELLNVSWTIIEGNLGELLVTLDLFDTNDSRKAMALWQQPFPAKHRYHLEIVRRFHNFLGAAVAHLAHSRRAATLFRRLAPDSFREWEERSRSVLERLDFLVAIRDFSVHAGTHASVLILQGTESGEFCGRVGFSVDRMLSEQESRLAKARSAQEKAAASAAIGRLRAAGESVEIRPVVIDYYKQVQEHRAWLRKELLDVWQGLSSDLSRWASDDDRPAVVQYFLDHPIPVLDGSAKVDGSA